MPTRFVMSRALGFACLLATACALGVAPAAQAASIRVDGTRKTIAFTASAGEANRLTVSQSGRTITFDETAGDLSVSAVDATCGTRHSGQRAECTMPTPDFTVQVIAGDRDDQVTARIARPVQLTGGAGNDQLTGGSAADQLTGDAGADRLDGGAGADQVSAGADDDTLLARDGAVDSLACGDGADTLEGDADDVVAEDCEGVARALATPGFGGTPVVGSDVPPAGALAPGRPAPAALLADPVAHMSGVPPAGLPEPEAGRTVALGVKSGTALVRLPGAPGYTPVAGPQRLPVGTSVDARAAIVSLVSAADLRGRRQAADFSGAVFTVAQRRSRSMVTVLQLTGGDLARCRPARRTTARAANAPKGRGTVRRLWGSGHGRFTTRGRNSATTVRGTIWSVTDTCAGTTTRVRRGAVAVRDFARKRTRMLRAGQSYLARPRAGRR